MPTLNTPTPAFSPRRCAILALTLLALAPLAGPARAATAPQPEKPGGEAAGAAPITVAEPVADLGTLIKGDTARHTFVLRNPGTEPVTIERAEPSCGCTVARFDRTIPPGGEGTVRAVVDTETLNGAGVSVIAVYVAGRDEPAATLQLRYNVVSKLLAEPGFARWVHVQHEAQGSISQTVYSTDGADFDVVSVESTVPALDVSFRKATEEERKKGVAGSQWHVEASLDADAPVGPLAGFIVVHTTHAVQKDLQIPISGFVRPTLFVEPQRAHFGTVTSEGPNQGTLHVRNFASKPIVVTGAQTDVPGVSARVEPVEEGRRYDVVVEAHAEEMKPGPFQGHVTITTDSDMMPKLTVDLSGTVTRRPPANAKGR